MIKLCYPNFWQTRNILAYLLLPFGWVFFILRISQADYLLRQVKFDAFTICVGNCTVGGTGKTQLIIALAKEFSKRNINFIILSKGYGGNVKTASLVTASSSPEEVGDEALELCHYGNSFVVPGMQ
jgi:tetraacyldisaccharide 4'-kinase